MPTPSEAKAEAKAAKLLKSGASAGARKVFWGGMAGATLAVVTGVVLLLFKFGLGLIHLSYDLPFAVRFTAQPNEAVMVYLDDDSHAILKQPRNEPWDRSLHARLLDRLTADGAKAVVFDIVFGNPGRNPEADAQFARAIRANGNVVLAVDNVPTAYGRESEGVEAKMLVPPYELFGEAAASLGLDEMHPADDLAVRELMRSSRDDLISPLSWAAAKLLAAKITLNDENRFVQRWVNYYGPATTIPNVSFYRVVQTDSEDKLPAGFFRGKTVFVGARLLTKFSDQQKDEYRTPYSRWAKSYPFMPGVEIHATAFLNLLHGDWLRRPSRNFELLALAVSGGVLGFGLVRFRPWVASAVALALMVLVSVGAYLSFDQLRVWFPWVLVIVQVFIALLWSIVFNSIQLYVQNKLYEASLALYLSPKLVRKFATNRDLLKPGAKKETLTILFSDIASFTSISEGMDSDELAKHMNLYFETAVSKCIHHTDGTIVKYIGDAIFAFWNAPDLQDDHQLRACQAALRFRDQPPQYMNNQQLITRIGLHTGVANVGNFGSTTRVDYTALGENINLASRMEGLNKYLGTEVLITGETQEGIAGRLVTRFLGQFRLKGFERNVGVYELVGPPEKAEAVRALHEAFEAALKSFQQKKLEEAEAAFRRVLALSENDGPAKFYLKHLAELKDHPLPEDWAGAVELKEK